MKSLREEKELVFKKWFCTLEQMVNIMDEPQAYQHFDK